MSKGLEAWERIKKGIDSNIWECGYWDDIEVIEKELKAFNNIKDTIKKDLKKYIKLKEDTNNPFMTHYYQGKIDYIDQLAIFDEELIEQEEL